MCHSSHFDAFFPVKISKMWNFCLKFWFLRNCLLIETWNLCHWIWQTSNPKYIPLKPLWCIFPSQNQQNVKFLAEILVFQEQLIIDTWNKCHWIWHTSNPKRHNHSSHYDAFFPVNHQQNVKFLSEILILQQLLIVEVWDIVPLNSWHSL